VRLGDTIIEVLLATGAFAFLAAWAVFVIWLFVRGKPRKVVERVMYGLMGIVGCAFGLAAL